MYIFEILYKSVIGIIRNKKKRPEVPPEPECEHVFLPIDSTKKVLACSKCGMLVKAKDLQPKPPANFFMNK